MNLVNLIPKAYQFCEFYHLLNKCCGFLVKFIVK